MAALTKDKNRRSKATGRKINVLVAANAIIFKGAYVGVNALGFAIQISDSDVLVPIGVADFGVDNTGGSNGDEDVTVTKGTFEFENGGTVVDQADVGRPVFVLDDNTVSKAAGVSDEVVAGILDRLDSVSGKPWVELTDGAALVSNAAISGGAAQPVTVTSGAIDPDIPLTKVSVTGTVAYQLADGTKEGQRIAMRTVVAASTPIGTLTPVTFADGTTILFNAIDEGAILEWHVVGGWHAVAIIGGATVA